MILSSVFWEILLTQKSPVIYTQVSDALNTKKQGFFYGHIH